MQAATEVSVGTSDTDRGSSYVAASTAVTKDLYIYSFSSFQFSSCIHRSALPSRSILHTIVLNLQAQEMEALESAVESSVLPEKYGPVPVPADGRPSPENIPIMRVVH